MDIFLNHRTDMKIYRLCSFLLSIAVTSVAAQAQIFNPDLPMIREFVISVDSINMQLKKHQHWQQHSISETNGSVQIPNTYYTHNGKSMGIIVVRDQTYTYHAFDARCAHCFYDNEESDGKVEMTGSLFARCKKCGAESPNLVLTGSGQLMGYDDEMQGYKYLDPYLVKVLKKGKKKYLLIYNIENGAHDEWLKQPENQILLENGRPYRHPMRPKPEWTF